MEATELCDFLVDAGARQPADLRGERRQAWCSFLKVLAANNVASAKHAAVARTLPTLTELSQWQVIRGRSGGLGDIHSIDLFAFLRDGTQAPARALAGLRWFWPQLGFERFAASSYPHRLLWLNQGWLRSWSTALYRIVQLYDAGDPRWSCLLADWLIMAACLRHKHFKRSHPICETQSTAHFWCARGKQLSMLLPCWLVCQQTSSRRLLRRIPLKAGGGLAGGVPALPHGWRFLTLLRRGMVACRVGGASFSALYRFAVWIALGSDHFQSLQPGSGSLRQAAPGHLGLHVFRRRPPY